jgi:hypothetical protein
MAAPTKDCNIGMGFKTGSHRFHRKSQKSVKPIKNQFEFKLQTFEQLQSVSTGKLVGIIDKLVQIQFFEKKILKNQENTKKLEKFLSVLVKKVFQICIIWLVKI